MSKHKNCQKCGLYNGHAPYCPMEGLGRPKTPIVMIAIWTVISLIVLVLLFGR